MARRMTKASAITVEQVKSSVSDDPILDELVKYKKIIDSDDIRYKQIIKEKLVTNDKIIYVLNNKELIESESENSDYFGINILPYYVISPTQTNVQNFICYEVQFDEEARYNGVIKYGQIIFTILCEQKNNEVTTSTGSRVGIARHDLLAALIMDEFNWSNCFGNQIHCISDKPSVVDTNYSCRTLIFEGEFPNSIASTKDGKSMVRNNYGINR